MKHKLSQVKPSAERYGVEISYSWGETEGLYGDYETPEQAYEHACSMACKEAYVQNEDFTPERDGCTVTFNASEYQIVLHYAYDNTYCIYKVTKQ